MTIIPVGAPPETVIKLMNRIGRVAPGLIKSIENRAVGAAASKYLDKMNPVIARLGEYWDEELLPEIKEHLRYWEGFDLSGATGKELLAHLEETVDRMRRAGEIHYLIAIPYLLAMSLFEDLYRELFGDENSLDAYRLLQGFDNKTLQTDRALWQLSRSALAVPEVREVLEEPAAGDVVPGLELTPGGRAFLAELRAFLEEYGQKGDRFCMVEDVRWIEDPTPVIENLKDYITQPDRDLEAELTAPAEERERLVAETRERLRGYPQPVVDRFETLLKAAQEATVIHEDHDFWLDYRCFYQARRVMQEFGRRFAGADAIEDPNDVFYLTLDELRETIQEAPNADRRAPISERKARLERFGAVRPSAMIGRMPLGEPPDDPMGRARPVLRRAAGGAGRPQRAARQRRFARRDPGTGQGGARPRRGRQTEARRRARDGDDGASVDAALRHRLGGGHRHRRRPEPLRGRRPRVPHPGRRRHR